MQSSNTSEPFVQDTFFTFSTSCSLSTLSFRPLVKFFNIRSLLLSRLLRLSSCSIKPALHETRNFAIRTEESREAPKQLAHRQADRKRKSSCIIYPLFPTHWWLRKDQLTAGMLFRKHLPKPSLIVSRKPGELDLFTWNPSGSTLHYSSHLYTVKRAVEKVHSPEGTSADSEVHRRPSVVKSSDFFWGGDLHIAPDICWRSAWGLVGQSRLKAWKALSGPQAFLLICIFKDSAHILQTYHTTWMTGRSLQDVLCYSL